jgi:protein SCO1/2
MLLSDRTRRLAAPMAALLLGVGLLIVALFFTVPRRAPGTAVVGGPFTLVDQDGRTVTERDFVGSPHLVFFGFTHCPDVCPTTLFQMTEILQATGDKGRTLKALLITVDPERDTPDVLKDYLSSFDERIQGLTGDQAAIDKVLKAYRSLARKVPTKDGGYTMEHTAIVYLMDRDDQFVSIFDIKRPPEEAARDLVKRL